MGGEIARERSSCGDLSVWGPIFQLSVFLERSKTL